MGKINRRTQWIANMNEKIKQKSSRNGTGNTGDWTHNIYLLSFDKNLFCFLAIRQKWSGLWP